MSTRARALSTVLAAALLAGAVQAAGQSPPEADLELRLPETVWAPDRTAGPPEAVTTPDQLLDPLLPAGERRRPEALTRLARAGFVGGVQRSLDADPARPAMRAFAVRLATPGAARGTLETLRWSLRARSATASVAVSELADPPGGRLIDAAGSDGARTVVAGFAAGAWLYGVEARALPGVPVDATALAGLAARLHQRQPERPLPGAAEPLGVTPELRAELGAVLAAAGRRPRAVPPVPRPGTVQAARLGGEDWAIAAFPGSRADPELFRRLPGAPWRAVGDPGGPGCPRIPAPVREVWGLSATCPAWTSAVARPDDPDALDADADPFQGLGIWVWEVARSGGESRIVELARRSGLRTAFVKSGDGPRYWRQFDRALPALRTAGLKVCGWQYVYGRRPVAEARVAARALARGADCFVVDAESEFERAGVGASARPHRAARRYMAELRRRAGFDRPVGMTSFAYVDSHSTLPYSAFLEEPNGADVLMPQVYWGAFRVPVARAMARTARWNALYDVPIAPIAGTYRRERPADLLRFRCLAAGYGWPGASYWSLQHTTSAQWPALGGGAACAEPRPAPRPYPTLARGDRGDPVVWLQGRLRAWGYPVARTGHFQARTRAAVRAFQSDHGLEPDGAAGPLTWAVLLERPPR